MCKKKLSLFDALIKEINNDLTYYQTPGIQSMEVVPYSGSRTDDTSFYSTGRRMAISRLVPGLRKRYIGPTIEDGPSDEDRSDAAVIEFLEDNLRCRVFNERFDPLSLTGFIQTVCGEVKVSLDSALNGHNGSCLNLSNVAKLMRVGPGKSSGLRGDAGTYARLCEGVMTFTSPDVAGVYKACILTSRLTAVTEAVRYAQFGQGDSFNTFATFTTVPKTNEKDRGICTQPSGNMVLQLATHGILAERLLTCYGCDLESQQESNRTLAYVGSLGRKSMKDHSWEFCTIDLSRASNFPWSIIRFLFPELWVEWLEMIRSPAMKIAGAVVPKHMCSTMGNGFTFSLMTILLSAIVKVLYSLAGLPEYDTHHLFGRLKTWAVYGDDIIVDKSVANALFGVLSALGFLVNSKKTYTEGLFRESCGADFYDGYPVRPVFLETLSTQADIYSLMNRLVLWGAQHSINLRGSLQLLRRALGKDYHRVPNWEDVSSGLHVPFSMCNQVPANVPPKVLGMLNPGNVPYRVNIASPKHRLLFIEKTKKRYYSDVHSRALLSYDYVADVKVTRKTLNYPGMLLCMLEGSVNRGRYGLRPLGPPNYVEKWRIAPGWGDVTLYSHTATLVFGQNMTSSVYGLWEEYVRRNLGKPSSLVSSLSN